MSAKSVSQIESGHSYKDPSKSKATFCPATANHPQSFSGEKHEPQSSRNSKKPTVDETQSLRHVSDSIPAGIWLMALISLCERFTYYGISAPFQNYIQNPLNDPLRPGALNLGQSAATKLNYFFSVFICDTHRSRNHCRLLAGEVQDFGRFHGDIPLWVPHTGRYLGPFSSQGTCWSTRPHHLYGCNWNWAGRN